MTIEEKRVNTMNPSKIRIINNHNLLSKFDQKKKKNRITTIKLSTIENEINHGRNKNATILLSFIVTTLIYEKKEKIDGTILLRNKILLVMLCHNIKFNFVFNLKTVLNYIIHTRL